MEKKRHIDEMDFKILLLLYKNPELTYAEIAEKLKTSPVTIHNRIKKLKEDCAFKKIVIIPNEVFGKQVTAFIQVSTIPGQEKSIGERISKFPEVLSVMGTTGDFDLLVKIVTSNIDELHQVIMEKIRSLEGVIRTNTILILFTIKEEFSYIPEEQ
ncbi:MAG: Lrp/AsnC family transcriptional regulator [Candidatus Bathyarchaeia archaeon]|nr:Lrp/AsnC family transcriptional regulator [Candidatus Bathyarchaeota archaeon]